jgi:23S rRNA (cytosine1962-C5)-methyltransferase
MTPETVNLRAMSYPIVQLHKGKEFSLQRHHPWIFSGAIHKKDADLQEGQIVEVFSSKGDYLATGYYAGGSIAIRVISFVQMPIDEEFWFEKIHRAWQYRSHLSILNEHTNVCRMFFGEGDGVPGLIMDYYDGHVVFQAHSGGVYMQKENILGATKRVLGTHLKSMYDKSAETLSKHFSTDVRNGYLLGSGSSEIIVKEHDHLFKIDFVGGQKTGFFIDQRENRKLLASYCKNRIVLNTFCYTGGFSVYAAAAGASQVDSVDVSQPAIDLCEQNIALNDLNNESAFVRDTFDFLKDKQDVYDLIVLDPPAFAKSRDSKHNAVIGYKRLNAMAMKLIRKNGIIFTFSCSGVVDKFLFYNTVAAAAFEAGRNIRVLNYLSQPADHPVTPNFPEGEYLKGMVLFVE